MHDSKLAELKAKVEATNKAHVEFHRLRPILLEAFRPLIGQKVRKVDGTLTKAAEALVPLPRLPWLSVFFNSNFGYSLCWEVKASANIERPNGGCVYYSCTVYVGNTRNGVLEDVKDGERGMSADYRTDYTVEDILAKLAAAEEAGKAYDAAKSACGLFTEFLDRRR